MEFKNWFYLKYQVYKKPLLLCLAIALPIFGWHSIAIGMHFDKDDNLQAMLEGLPEEEAEGLRQALRASKALDYTAQYPLHAAVMRGNIEDIQGEILLLEDSSKINEEDNEGKTPLYVAAFYRNKPVIKLLIENGAQSDNVFGHEKSDFLEKPMYKAIKDLLRNGALMSDDITVPSAANVPNGNLTPKKPIRRRVKFDKKTIKETLKNIQDPREGIIVINALINKLINNNDVKGLRTLLNYQIEYVQLSLRDEAILCHAINCAPENDHRIVEMLFSAIHLEDLSEQGLVCCFLSAEKKHDDDLMQTFEDHINRTYA